MAIEAVTPALVKHIYPLNQLSKEGLDQLLPSMRVRWFDKGREVFNVGDSPDDHIYVLEGSLSVVDRGETRFQTVGPATEGEAFPLPYIVPSVHRARTVASTKLLMVDRRKLLDVLERFQPSSPQAMEQTFRTVAKAVAAEDDETSWQAAFLRPPGFQRIAGQDLRRAFDLMTPVQYKAGDVVLEQGNPADYFYVVRRGRCEVLRAFGANTDMVRVAEYGPGATLGEDALISGSPRNATVRMLTDGCLMRLDGDDFRFLIKRALVRGVDWGEARQMVARGSRWLDVRMPEERKGGHLPHCITIAHPVVRGRLFTADPQMSYVVVCARGFDAPVIAFTLCKYGFDAYFLREGYKAVPKDELVTADL